MLKLFKTKLKKELNLATQGCLALYECLKGLIEVNDKENKALEQGQFNNLNRLIERKLNFTEDMERIYLFLEPYKDELKTLVEVSLLNQIKASYNKLEELSQKNMILLQSSIEVANILIKMQKETQISKTISQFGYDKKGKFSALKNLEKIVPAISLNNKI